MTDLTSAYLAKHGFIPAITENPHPRLNLCMVIPCFNESGLTSSLQSIWECLRPETAVEVIVVINSAENCTMEILARNQQTLRETAAWINDHPDEKLRFHLIHRPNLPNKFAGVGLARKIGMDEAVYRLNNINHPNGVIACFDADSTCSSNYLTELENHFKQYPKTTAASINFEHPIAGTDFNIDAYRGIYLYELHLRYLNQAMRYAQHPHAYHTVGSSCAVRAMDYVKQGGMNKRQAGEDFYFLQKFIALGSFSEINGTTVYPSPRESNRVPFGTGASMMRWKSEKTMLTYSLRAFEDIKSFINLSNEFYTWTPSQVSSGLTSLSAALQDFLRLNDFENELQSVIANSASPKTFRDRFFKWFNAFRVIKFLNFSHEKYYTKAEVAGEAGSLIQKSKLKAVFSDPLDLLNVYRDLDKSGFGLTSQ